MANVIKPMRSRMSNCICTVFLFLILSLFFPEDIQAEDTGEPIPNVIFILADDAGYGDFGKYGQSDILTPNIDRMAEEGLLFTNHYAGAPVCSPSRSSLLTGLHTGHTPVRGNKEVSPEGQHPLPANTFTVARMLQDIDVDTAVIGKWGLGYPGSSGTPEMQGFDYFFGYNCQRQAHNYYPDHLWENSERVELDGKTYTHDLFTEKTLSYLTRQKDKPFFLYLAYTIPHAALQVPDLGLYADEDWPDNMKKYAAMISRMDKDVGRILNKLEELQLDEKTLIIFSSDNGPHAEGGADPAFFESFGPFRGIKRDLYEGGIRVPMIARWTGTIAPNQTSHHSSAFWDFLPTMADIYNIPPPEDLDGISYLPVLLGDEKAQREHEYLYWEFQENGGVQAVRMGKWKGVRKFVRLFPNGPIELYDLDSDPGETTDLSRKNKIITKEISDIMISARNESSDFPLIGKNPLRTGLENGWLFLIPLAISVFLTGLFMRKPKRREMRNFIKALSLKDKFVLSAKGASTTALCALSIFSPIMVMSRWFTISVGLSLAGVVGFTVSSILLLKNEKNWVSILTKPIYKNIPQLFLLLFWLGLGSSVLSWPFIILLSLWLILRLR